VRANQYLIVAITVFALAEVRVAVAGQSGSPTGVAHGSHDGRQRGGTMTEHHGHHAPAIALTFAELEQTARDLVAARQATEKYHVVRVAVAAGYRAIGADVPGMGIHYVRSAGHQHFSITEPSILLYERDTSVTGALRLIGVSYLFVSPTDSDGQPANPPFPKALASWHKHNNVCVLADNSTSLDLSEQQCTARGGRFTPETSWMLHAWIWKDSPAGVFSPTNPLVR
jgi:hypothetical protein